MSNRLQDARPGMVRDVRLFRPEMEIYTIEAGLSKQSENVYFRVSKIEVHFFANCTKLRNGDNFAAFSLHNSGGCDKILTSMHSGISVFFYAKLLFP